MTTAGTAPAPGRAPACLDESAARRRFARTVHIGFFVVLAASTMRYIVWRGDLAEALPVILAAAGFALLYAAGIAALDPAAGLAPAAGVGPLGAARVWAVRVWAGRFWGGRLRSDQARMVWLLAVVAVWTGLTLWIAPFSWCAVPLFFLVLHELPTRPAIPLIIWLAVVAGVIQEIHARLSWDPSPLLAPVVIAVMSTVIYRQLHNENTRRQALIEDLVRTRDALAGSERAAGVLQERVRLSQEIHDTLAQGLSSMHLLLNAADQQWTSAPDEARAHVRRAADAARENMAEARRFVRDLAPPALDGNSLPDALRRLCRDTGGHRDTAGHSGPEVKFVLDGDPFALGVDAEVALLRVAQGALANVLQHAQARTAVVTLGYLTDEVTLDVCDDGVGFDPAAPQVAPGRGFGLRAIRHRVDALGGTVTVESAPGEGTALAVALPAAGPEVVTTSTAHAGGEA